MVLPKKKYLMNNAKISPLWMHYVPNLIDRKTNLPNPYPYPEQNIDPLIPRIWEKKKLRLWWHRKEFKPNPYPLIFLFCPNIIMYEVYSSGCMHEITNFSIYLYSLHQKIWCKESLMLGHAPIAQKVMTK